MIAFPGTVALTPQPPLSSVSPKHLLMIRVNQHISEQFWFLKFLMVVDTELGCLTETRPSAPYKTYDMVRFSGLQIEAQEQSPRNSAHGFLLELEISSTRWEQDRTLFVYAPGYPMYHSAGRSFRNIQAVRVLLLTGAHHHGPDWAEMSPVSSFKWKIWDKAEKAWRQRHESLEKILV